MENYTKVEASLIKQMFELHFSNFSLMLLYSLMRKAWLLKANFGTASPVYLLIGVCIYFQSEHNPQNTICAFIIYYMFRPFWPLSSRFHNNLHGKVYKYILPFGRQCDCELNQMVLMARVFIGSIWRQRIGFCTLQEATCFYTFLTSWKDDLPRLV
jgi:hypothetical protein